MINVNKTPFIDDLFKYKTRTRKNATYTTHNEILIQGKKIPFFSITKQSIRTRIYYLNKDIDRLFYYCYYDYELLWLLF